MRLLGKVDKVKSHLSLLAYTRDLLKGNCTSTSDFFSRSQVIHVIFILPSADAERPIPRECEELVASLLRKNSSSSSGLSTRGSRSPKRKRTVEGALEKSSDSQAATGNMKRTCKKEDASHCEPSALNLMMHFKLIMTIVFLDSEKRFDFLWAHC